MRIFLAGLLLSIGLAGPALAQPITISPQQIGEIFCISRLGNDMAPVEGLLTPGLAAAMASAEEKDAAWAKANPGDKPPLGDGIPWQSYPDYAGKCDVGDITTNGDHARVAIRYGFPEAPDANFTDTLELIQVPDPFDTPLWRIDDVAYSTDGTLRSALETAFTE